ncbi:sulfatase [Allobranchiibius sp. GilTou73]|uniref:sulfatase family protein n=1 Tax=Allobranchiibius sp. GilTou73 TaxID=2904523 RepID=UPI001F37B6AC|nr:sulfatase [Allobranchiibius sp. GilTou73]UIJ34348.1 sulfatase [Allobranchiibius sp. GilTou73]
MKRQRLVRQVMACAVAVAFATVLACCSTGGAPTTTAATSGSTSGSGSGSTSDKPNVVFVLTDDLSMNLISHMPQVQALQKAGTTMSNYRVVDSLCCPSRSAIFTGEYPHNDGVFTNSGSDGGYDAYNKNGDAQKSYALSMQEAGYTTGFMGKYLNGYQPTDPKPAGWDEWDVAGNGYPEFNYTLNENGKQVKYGHSANDYMVDVLSGKADSFISASASSGKPFMLQVATFAPHAPYTPAPRYASAAQGLAYPKTPAYDALPSNPPSWLKGRPTLKAGQEKKLLNGYRKRVEADLAVNDLIGNVRKTLQAKGIADNTYIVFSSDNGYHMGEYRLTAGKQTAFDTDIHVPMIVSGPGVPADRTVTQPMSNVDLAPTFESLAGATVPSTVDGVSMVDAWHGKPPADAPQAVLIEHHGPDNTPGDPDRQGKKAADPPSYEAVRTPDALYVRYASGEEEFYDTTKDPYELHNLGSKAVPASLRTALAALEKCKGATACQAAARV